MCRATAETVHAALCRNYQLRHVFALTQVSLHDFCQAWVAACDAHIERALAAVSAQTTTNCELAKKTRHALGALSDDWRRSDADPRNQSLSRTAFDRRMRHRSWAMAIVPALYLVVDALSGQQEKRRKGVALKLATAIGTS